MNNRDTKHAVKAPVAASFAKSKCELPMLCFAFL